MAAYVYVGADILIYVYAYARQAHTRMKTKRVSTGLLHEVTVYEHQRDDDATNATVRTIRLDIVILGKLL